VAKDRQRRRRKGSGGNPARSTRARETRARDMGLDDPTIDEAGLTDPVPAPDPLKNSSADADMARFAETGPDAEDDPFAGEDTLERAPDRLEEEAVSARTTDPSVREAQHPERERRDRGRLLTFFRHCIEELRRVQWPDRKHVFQATAVVLGFVLVAGGWLGLMDAIWQPVVNAIL
jgi:preprotein translocase subunit SecE